MGLRICPGLSRLGGEHGRQDREERPEEVPVKVYILNDCAVCAAANAPATSASQCGYLPGRLC